MRHRFLLGVVLFLGCGRIETSIDAGSDADLFDGAAQACSVPCGPTQTCCSGQCVDLNLNPEHCGQCTTNCQTAVCLGGACLGDASGCPAGTKPAQNGPLTSVCCPVTDICGCEPHCGVSSRVFKTDIHYLSDAEEKELQSQLRALRLASYRYKDSLDDGRTHVGYILEDSPDAASSDLARSRVDLYTYSTMAVATLHAQDEKIASLEAQMKELRARQDALEAKCVAKRP
jgi:hypothetical protein